MSGLGKQMSNIIRKHNKHEMDFFTQSLLSLTWLPLLSLFLISVVSVLYLIKAVRRGNKMIESNHPPGPPKLPFIGNLHQLGRIPHLSLSKLSEKYGPLMHLKLGQIHTLVISSPEMAKQVLKTHDLECCSRPFSHGTKVLTYNFRDLAFTPYSSYWREIRKLSMLELFTVKRVQSFMNVRAEEVGNLMQSLSRLCGTPVEISELIFNLTNTVICRVAYGKNYDGDQFRGAKVEDKMYEIMLMLSSFWATDFFPRFGGIVDTAMGQHRRLGKCFSGLDAFFERLIDEHLEPARPPPQQQDFIDILIDISKDENAPVHLTRENIKAVLFNIFIGGIDTSSLTIVWAMTELSKNPRVMEKVKDELRRCIGNKRKVEETEVEKLKYLKNVVKETFRLHPPVPLLLPREVRKHFKIFGYDIYPETRILVNTWAMGRDPNVWKNPQEFYPERFDHSSIDFKGNNFELLPFGAGRRICPGMTMGSIAVEFTLANLLHCFDWELPPGMKPEDINMDEDEGLTIRKKVPLFLVPNKCMLEE